MYTIGIVQGALTTRASAIAFNFFTAIFPFLLFIIIVIPVIPFENFQVDFLDFLNSELFVFPKKTKPRLYNKIRIENSGI